VVKNPHNSENQAGSFSQERPPEASAPTPLYLPVRVLTRRWARWFLQKQGITPMPLPQSDAACCPRSSDASALPTKDAASSN
jgi:hypothetical protein